MWFWPVNEMIELVKYFFFFNFTYAWRVFAYSMLNTTVPEDSQLHVSVPYDSGRTSFQTTVFLNNTGILKSPSVRTSILFCVWLCGLRVKDSVYVTCFIQTGCSICTSGAWVAGRSYGFDSYVPLTDFSRGMVTEPFLKCWQVAMFNADVYRTLQTVCFVVILCIVTCRQDVAWIS
jgi:hypothetical protein